MAVKVGWSCSLMQNIKITRTDPSEFKNRPLGIHQESRVDPLENRNPVRQNIKITRTYPSGDKSNKTTPKGGPATPGYGVCGKPHGLMKRAPHEAV
jgi:hypothetical protein